MTTTTLEVRTAALGPVELRAGGDNPGTLHGYAAVFNRLSQNLGGFVEMVDPGAFTKSLADQVPVMARYNHDNNYLLGTTDAATLRLLVDNIGLAYDVDLPDTTAGRDVRALAGRGDLRHSSFAFYTLEDQWSVTEQGFPLRILRAVQLVDVAPVNDPAYRDTSVGLRSFATRLGVDVDDLPSLAPAEIRSRLTAPQEPTSATETSTEPVDQGQRATHPTIDVRRRLLDLEAQR